MRLITAALTVFALCAPGLADSPQVAGQPCVVTEEMGLSSRDEARINMLASSRTRGLAAALTSQSAADRQVVSEIFAGGLSPLQTIVPGRYQCRTIKMGGISELVVYTWFACEIGQEDAMLTLRKTSGSQRTFGTLTKSGDGLLYRGALHYSDENPVMYDGASERDQVGCLLKDYEDGNRFVLELPQPAFESFHDVLELRPAN
jgi:hypothetical protein